MKITVYPISPVLTALAIKLVLLTLILFTSAATPLYGRNDHPIHDPQDEIMEQIGVDEKLGRQIPLDIEFTDQDGKAVKIKEYFSGEPVILTLNFYECPMLCPMTFKNLVDTMQDMETLSLEKDFRIVTISFNENDTIETAKQKSLQTLEMIEGMKEPQRRWPFLVGNADEIKKLTDSVGYKYKKLEKGDFAHPATMIILSGNGKVSRYLHGIKVKPQDLRLALIEASEGKIGSSPTLNRILMYCFRYDPQGKKYVLYAWNIMKATGILTMALLGILFYLILKRKPTY